MLVRCDAECCARSNCSWSPLFWGEEGHRVTPYEKLRLLAVTGGVPRYLEELNPALSADANIQRMCLSPEGLLFNEFDNIFTDLFRSRNETYRRLVAALVDGPLDLDGLWRACEGSPNRQMSFWCTKNTLMKCLQNDNCCLTTSLVTRVLRRATRPMSWRDWRARLR